MLAVLLLRGAQTIGELKSRTERQHDFGSIDEVAATLDATGLTSPGRWSAQLDRRPGQKDARWIELLSPTPSVDRRRTRQRPAR